MTYLSIGEVTSRNRTDCAVMDGKVQVSWAEKEDSPWQDDETQEKIRCIRAARGGRIVQHAL